MKRSILAVILAALVAAALTAPAVGQAGMISVKGKVTDEKGQPITDATVEWTSLDTGRKITLKTDKRGEYFSVGVPSGNYRVVLSKNGQTIFQFNSVPVRLTSDEFVLDFDLAKERQRAQAEGQAQLTEEQKKQLEAEQKEREKLQNLNELLAQANTAMQGGNHQQAVDLLTQATQIDATKDLLWARLGDAHAAASQPQEAVEAYQKAIAIKPSGAYYNNLGQAHIKARNTDEAIKAYTMAAQVEPANAGQYYYNLGAVLTNTGKLDEAIAAFDKAIAVDPNRADAYYWKGVNLLGKATLKGDKMVAPEGTAEAFNKYLELQPNGQFAEPAKQMLASIGAKIETQYGERRRKR